jgi:hypothetical protein
VIAEKILSADPFWDIRSQEGDFRQALELDIRDLEKGILTAEKALALRASPGWEPFLQTVRALLESRTAELVAAKTAHEATLLQGRVRELRAVLALMQQTEHSMQVLRDRLAVRIKERDARFAGQKVKPLGATS